MNTALTMLQTSKRPTLEPSFNLPIASALCPKNLPCELTFQSTIDHLGEEMPCQRPEVSGAAERQRQRQDHLCEYSMSEDKPPDPNPMPLFPIKHMYLLASSFFFL